jgi:hypothetical protein
MECKTNEHDKRGRKAHRKLSSWMQTFEKKTLFNGHYNEELALVSARNVKNKLKPQPLVHLIYAICIRFVPSQYFSAWVKASAGKFK